MLSKTALHAVKALVALMEYHEGSFAAAETLAREIGAPRNYLGKLLQVLTRAKFVESKKGVEGGFRLALNPKKTTVYEVMELFDDSSRMDQCFLGQSSCSAKNACAVHSEWKTAKDAYLAFLKKTTIADFVK